MNRAVIFDVDGTLIDSVDLHAHAWLDTFRHFGHEIPYAKIRSEIGKGADQFLPVFISRDEQELKGREMSQFRAELMKRKYLPSARPFPKVRELMERIRSDGKRIVLASSAQRDEVSQYEEMLGIRDLLDSSTSSDDVEQSKPEPDIFIAALERLRDVDATEAIAVGDTPYDAKAARKAGLRTICLLSGGFPEHDLLAAGCIAIYRSPADLLTHYAESPLSNSAPVPD